VGLALAEWTCREWGRLDEGLQRRSGRTLDIGTVVPLFFVVLGVRQLLAGPGLDVVPWYVAFYYAFESFRHYYGRGRPMR
jgi:hypothetical protein